MVMYEVTLVNQLRAEVTYGYRHAKVSPPARRWLSTRGRPFETALGEVRQLHSDRARPTPPRTP